MPQAQSEFDYILLNDARLEIIFGGINNDANKIHILHTITMKWTYSQVKCY